MPRPAGTALRALLVVLAAFGLGSCSGGEPVATFEPVTDPAQLFSRLTLDHHAINLSTATSNTLQLTATPYNALGEPMPELPAPTFVSLDTTAVQVSAEGLVTARRDAAVVKVVAEIVAPGNIRRTDTTYVSVISTEPATLTSLTLDPAPPDTAIWAIPALGQTNAAILPFFGVQPPPGVPVAMLRARAFDATNTEIAGLVMEYVSLDSAVATVDRWSGAVSPKQPGTVRVVARTTAYGISKVDTATFTATLPVGMDVVIHPTPNGTPTVGPREGLVASEYRIAPHGYVFWLNFMNETVDVKFEDPTNVVDPGSRCGVFSSNPDFVFLFGPGPHCGAGDVLIPPVTSDCPFFPDKLFCSFRIMQIRQFPVPGVYRFHSTQTGITGRIVVSGEVPAGAAEP